LNAWEEKRQMKLEFYHETDFSPFPGAEVKLSVGGRYVAVMKEGEIKHACRVTGEPKTLDAKS
jgi:hypothetical protein